MALGPVGHGDYPIRLHNLGVHYRTWYGLSREPEALAKAIELSREAVAIIPKVPQEIPPTLLRDLYVSLAGHLIERAGYDDWEEAHRYLRAALAQQVDESGRQQGERFLLDYLRGKENLYRLTVRCCLELAGRCDAQARSSEARDLREQAWMAAELGKGRLFAGALASESQFMVDSSNPRVTELLSLIREVRQEQLVRGQTVSGERAPDKVKLCGVHPLSGMKNCADNYTGIWLNFRPWIRRWPA